MTEKNSAFQPSTGFILAARKIGIAATLLCGSAVSAQTIIGGTYDCPILLASPGTEPPCPREVPTNPYGPPPCDECCEGDTEIQFADSGKNLSDPINIATGDYQLRQSDLVIPGVGLDFKFSRYYRSRSGLWSLHYPQADPSLNYPEADPLYPPELDFTTVLASPMGMNWDHSYNIQARVSGDVSDQDDLEVLLMLGNGRVDRFWRVDSGLLDESIDVDSTWFAYRNNQYTGLVFYDPETGLVRYSDSEGTEILFEAASSSAKTVYADSITDRNGNEIDLVYEDVVIGGVTYRRLDYVEDTLDNVIDFSYHIDDLVNNTIHADSDFSGQSFSDDVSDRLKFLLFSIEDHADRVCEYQYTLHDWNGTASDHRKILLTEVTLPEIDNTADFPLDPEHRRFPNGRTWQFGYDTADDNPTDRPDSAGDMIWWAGQLTTVTDPNGNTIVENEYTDPVWDGGWRTDYRVSRQEYGGAAYNYIVTDTDGNPYTASTNFDDDYYVWVNNRRGYVTRIKYSGGNNAIGGGRVLGKTEYLNPASNKDAVSHAGTSSSANMPSALDTRATTASHDEDYQDWQPRTVTNPEGYVEIVRTFADDATGSPDDVDPRKAQAITSRKRAASVSSMDNSSDPDTDDVIEERWAYNFGFGGCCGSDFPSAYQDGRGNFTFYKYDDFGNVLAIARGVPNGTASVSLSTVYNATSASDIESVAASIDRYTYRTVSGRITGQVETHTHPTSLVASGGGSASFNRVDQYLYYASGAQKDRLQKVIVDSDGSGLKLATWYEYDAVGNVTKMIEPGSNVSTANGDYSVSVYNQAGQVVRTLSFAGGTAVALAQSDYYYDANGNLLRSDIKNWNENLVGNGVIDTDHVITTLYDYDALNYRIRSAREIGDVLLGKTPGSGVFSAAGLATSPDWAVTEYGYDEGKNLEVVREPMSTAGLQPDNGRVMIYDDRNLVVRLYQGTIDTVPPPNLSEPSVNTVLVTEFTYDANGRRIATTIDPDGPAPRTSSTAYDVFDRPVSMTDPMGNVTSYTYDDASNAIKTIVSGQVVDVAGGAGNTLLSISVSEYDTLNRQNTHLVGIFDAEDASTLPSGVPAAWNWSRTEYNKDSSVRSVEVPSGDSPKPLPSGSGTSATTSYLYDTAGRRVLATDELGNLTAFAYEPDSDLIAIESTEKAAGFADQVFRATHEYDGLGRRTKAVEGSYGTGTPTGPQNTTLMAYDSRSQLVRSTDPRGTITTQSYDGLGRNTATIVDSSGLDIQTVVEYDKSSRVTGLTDDNGHLTSYDFDSLGREIERTYADGTSSSTIYNSTGDTWKTFDARNFEVRNQYDLNGRLSSRTVIKAQLPDQNIGSKNEDYLYDGLNRVVSAQNDFSLVTRAYDSRGLMLSETINADTNAFNPSNPFPAAADRTVTNEYDIAGNLVLCTYPSGREVEREYDRLNRVTTISDGGTAGEIAEYSYQGPGRVLSRSTGDGSGKITATYAYSGFSGDSAPTGDFGFRNIRSIEHRNVSDTLLEGRSFTWDAAGNKTSHNDLRTRTDPPDTDLRGERSFGYDLANRLATSAMIFPDDSSTDGEGTIGYILDGVHNRAEIQQLSGTYTAGAAVGDYTALSAADGDGSVKHAELNQYTLVPRLDDPTSFLEHAYDADGNLMLVAEYPRAADLNGDYINDPGDAAAFAALFQAEDPSVDYNNDDVFDNSDTAAFVSAYNSNPEGYGFYHATFGYDYRNQLVSFDALRGSTRTKSSDYRYDCFNRRIVAFIDADGDETVDEMKYFVYAGQASRQLVEEYSEIDDDPTSTVRKSYAYGNYIDEVLTMRDHLPAGDDDYFYHQDDLFSIYALTDEDGLVVERYDYGDYGQVTVQDKDGTPRSISAYGSAQAFTGRILSIELSLDDGGQFLQYRNRYMSAVSGRFLQRDPLGYLDEMSLYHFVKSRPTGYTDPFGLDVWYENTTAVSGFHRRICVDMWNYDCTKKRGKFCISFGTDGSPGSSSRGISSGNGGSSDSDSSGDSSSSGEEQVTPMEKRQLPPGTYFPLDGPDQDGDGIVYEDNEDEATKEVKRKTTTCEQDKEIMVYFRRLVGQRANYELFGQSCRDFSRDTFKYIDKKMFD